MCFRCGKTIHLKVRSLVIIRHAIVHYGINAEICVRSYEIFKETTYVLGFRCGTERGMLPCLFIFIVLTLHSFKTSVIYSKSLLVFAEYTYSSG